MIRTLTRWAAALVVALGISAASPALVFAQQRPNEEGLFPQEAPPVATESDPLYGYVAMFFLAAGAIFIVCKSARR